MNSTKIIATGGLLAGLAVALGAFAAHGLKSSLSPEALGWFQTAASYQSTHALALIACGILRLHTPQSRMLHYAAVAFILGIVLFSGSLYIMALTGITKLGMITPLGGLSFLIAWGCFSLGALQTDNTQQP